MKFYIISFLYVYLPFLTLLPLLTLFLPYGPCSFVNYIPSLFTHLGVFIFAVQSSQNTFLPGRCMTNSLISVRLLIQCHLSWRSSLANLPLVCHIIFIAHIDIPCYIFVYCSLYISPW